jgi:hypothetical protein
MRQMFADDVAAGRANNVPNKENIHLKRLARCGDAAQRGAGGQVECISIAMEVCDYGRNRSPR